MLTVRSLIDSVAVGAVLAVIISVLVILFFVLLVIDFVQLIIFLVRGIKLRRRTARAGTRPGDSAYSQVGPPQMSAQMREKPLERYADGDSSSRDSPPVGAEGEGDRLFGRSSMTLGNDQPRGNLSNKPISAVPSSTNGSHFNEGL
jgi:hypothetical protein